MGVERTKKVQAVVATTYLCLVSSMIIFPLIFSRYQIVPVLVWHNDSGRHLFFFSLLSSFFFFLFQWLWTREYSVALTSGASSVKEVG